MKLKCDDGVTRNFIPSEPSSRAFQLYTEVSCEDCDEEFGVHNITVVKDRLRAHRCNPAAFRKKRRMVRREKERTKD